MYAKLHNNLFISTCSSYWDIKSSWEICEKKFMVKNTHLLNWHMFQCNYTRVDQASDSMMVLTFYYQRVGAWCLLLTRPAVAQLEYFSSALTVYELKFLSLLYHMLIWFGCFSFWCVFSSLCHSLVYDLWSCYFLVIQQLKLPCEYSTNCTIWTLSVRNINAIGLFLELSHCLWFIALSIV